ncbi:MAG: hypothetical protein HY584_00160, partial [Candidatus Omnitrophica bacterium]|nr:hypothetical protein [Candidatus Omnitrophota bacterium]
MIILLRFLIVIGFALIGHYLGAYYLSRELSDQFPWFGALLGSLAAFAVVLLDLYFKRLSVKNILSVLIGSTLGLWTHSLLMQVIYKYAPGIPQEHVGQIGVITAVIFAYLGAITVLRGQD